MAEVLEVLMIICFGLSWPVNIVKAWKARTAKGTSVLFYSLILIGYVFGLLSKAVKYCDGISTPWYVWLAYSLNAIMICIGIGLYFRNLLLDRHVEKD